MGRQLWKWYEFPLMVKYGESRITLHLDKSKMYYTSRTGFTLSCETYLEYPKLFTQISSEMYRHRVVIEQRPVVVDWCIGEQPEVKKK